MWSPPQLLDFELFSPPTILFTMGYCRLVFFCKFEPVYWLLLFEYWSGLAIYRRSWLDPVKRCSFAELFAKFLEKHLGFAWISWRCILLSAIGQRFSNRSRLWRFKTTCRCLRHSPSLCLTFKSGQKYNQMSRSRHKRDLLPKIWPAAEGRMWCQIRN